MFINELIFTLTAMLSLSNVVLTLNLKDTTNNWKHKCELVTLE